MEMNTPVGEIITLSDPPDYIIVKLKIEMDIDSNLRIENDSSLIPISQEDCQFSVSYKLWIMSKTLSNNPVKVEVKDKSGVQMAFAYTFHKAFGQTIPRLITCLSKRPQYLFQLTYRLLLVALSRVEEGKNMRLLFDPKDDLSYLTELKPPKDYFVWIKGFENNNDNKWDENVSLKEFLKDEEKIISMPKSKKSDRKKELCDLTQIQNKRRITNLEVITMVQLIVMIYQYLR